MTSQKFELAYKKLNPAQKKAVDALEGPVMVVAGPGTGKTQILAIRIANILLKTDTEPENTLALTFTESGVLAMRRRLAEMIGTPAYKVKISTFHGFCNEVIKDYPEYFPRIVGAIHISEVDQFKILEEIISRLPLKRLKTFGDEFFYIKDINKAVEKLKREGVSPEQLAQYASRELERFAAIPDRYHEKGRYQGQMKGEYVDLEKQLTKLDELAQIYAAYQHALEERRLYDYNDMILEVRLSLETEVELRLVLQEKYQYILVDEHQDTNNAQNRVLELLADFYDEPNLFVVGDEKQAIYKFQGASLENFLYFKQKYPSAQVVWLENNYRSSQLVLDAAHSLILSDPIHSDSKKLKAGANHADKPIALYEFSTELAEDYFIANDIKRLIEEGINPDEIAVFYRTNADGESVATMLERLGVPFIVEANQDLLVDSDLSKLIILFQAIHDFGNEELFFQALHLDFLKVLPLEIYNLAKLCQEKKRPCFELIADEKILAVKELLAELSKKARNENLGKFFERAVRESGYLSALLSGTDPLLSIRKLQRFFREVKQLIERNKRAKLADLIEYLKRLETHELSIKQNPGGLVSGRVRLMTAHKSKGLEFDHVYIIRAADGRWGNKRVMDKIKLPPALFAVSETIREIEGDDNGDERRLFYVALTRARKCLTITYGRVKEDGKEQVVSQFVTELDPALIEKGAVTEIEGELEAHPEIFFTAAEQIDLKLEQKLVKDIFLKQGLAVTHLNNYLECPWKYFYSNLLRLPQAPSPAQLYGIAVHAALKEFFDRLGKDDPATPADKNFLLERFAYYLNEQPLTAKDYERVLREGTEFLEGYYNEWQDSWITNTINEYKIKGVEFELPGLETPIKLKGDIDKIEILDDSGHINVVDYKTSTPKTRGQIEGTTKDSKGNIKRQLVFYKLLLDNYEGHKFKMTSGEVDFLRPDPKGKYKQEKLVITDEDTEVLKGEIATTVDEIVNLKFWNKRCDEPKCEYCRMRDLMA